jgi:hypothetical protein
MEFDTEFIQFTSLGPSIYRLRKPKTTEIRTLAVERMDGS